MNLAKRPRLWPGLNCLACLCPPLPTGLQYAGNCCPVGARAGPKGCQHPGENDIKHCISSTPPSFETGCPTLIHILGFHTWPQRVPKGSHLQLELRFAKHVDVQGQLQLCSVLFKHTPKRNGNVSQHRAVPYAPSASRGMWALAEHIASQQSLATFENICLTAA